MPLFREWQVRPLESVYPVVYLDALFVSVRDGVQVRKRAFYVAIGVTLDGHRDVLGIWAAEAEGAKFWLNILNDLRNRGIQSDWVAPKFFHRHYPWVFPYPRAFLIGIR